MNGLNRQTCTRCIMDTSDTDIVFDSNGVCNHCNDAELRLPDYTFTSTQIEKNIQLLRLRIKQRQRGTYDSILGLSGGVDSSYVAYLAMTMGLNPLCVHFDNGWNSSIAIKNIRNIIEHTGFDLYTYVIDWKEFRELQRSFLMSSVVDVEMLTDHAILSSLYDIAKKYNIKTILSGDNYVTEHGMPKKWVWRKSDLRNILSINKEFSNTNIKSYPTLSTIKIIAMRILRTGSIIERPLNLINYKKNISKNTLRDELEWEDYGGKHCESIFTKFYQEYILPVKFGIDKRLPHLSCLIRNGEIDRSYALKEINQLPYNEKKIEVDVEYILKKLELSSEEFQSIMDNAPVSHDKYKSDASYITTLTDAIKWFYII